MSIPGRGNVRGRGNVKGRASVQGVPGFEEELWSWSGGSKVKQGGDAVEEPGLQGLAGPGEDSARF